MWWIVTVIGGVLALAGAPTGTEAGTARSRPAPDGDCPDPCTKDGLIHAEVSAAVSDRVAAAVKVTLPNARLREAARLTLPCRFQVDARHSWSLVLSNGEEFRAYHENNPSGFAPAFGFSQPLTRSYTLNFTPVNEASLNPQPCSEKLATYQPKLQLCSGFGSADSFFGAAAGSSATGIAHYTSSGTGLNLDFDVAEINGTLVSLSFMPPPDAPGGTVTLIFQAGRATYRVFLDVPKG